MAAVECLKDLVATGQVSKNFMIWTWTVRAYILDKCVLSACDSWWNLSERGHPGAPKGWGCGGGGCCSYSAAGQWAAGDHLTFLQAGWLLVCCSVDGPGQVGAWGLCIMSTVSGAQNRSVRGWVLVSEAHIILSKIFQSSIVFIVTLYCPLQAASADKCSTFTVWPTALKERSWASGENGLEAPALLGHHLASARTPKRCSSLVCPRSAPPHTQLGSR